ncbi:MAG: hypothetical protein QM840_10990 [Verrucomicrobiota bacterium]|nr:hypothetical protein [Verrucomicrobiota bacterium]
MYKGCTRDAHRVYQLKSDGLPVSIPCTPLVHGLMSVGIQGPCRIMATGVRKGRNKERGEGDNF